MPDAQVTASAKLIAAQRRNKKRYCGICGQSFYAIGRKLYCSVTCQRVAKRKQDNASKVRWRERRRQARGQE